MTFQDSKAYSKAWTVPIRAQLATDTELLEAVCNEARSGQEHWVGSVSDAEKSAVKVAPEVLAKYVGVYKGLYLERPPHGRGYSLRRCTVCRPERGEKRPLVPQSETYFSGNGLTYQFTGDDHGIATHVIESRLSGDYKYERQK